MAISLCGNIGANTGAIECDIKRGIPAALIFGAASFSPANYADVTTFETAFLSKFKQPAGSSDKLFLLPEVQAVANNTEAPKEGTLGLGFKEILLEGKPGYTFDILCGTNLEKKLRQFNGQIVPVTVFDQNNRVWGMRDSAQNFKGCKALIYVAAAGYGDGQNTTTTKVTVSFVSAKDVFDSAAFVSSTLSVGDITGLLDVELKYVSNATNAYKIKGLIDNADIVNPLNAYDTYADEMAAAGMWTATNVATGAAITITSVAKDPAIKGWTVTLDSTAHTALSSGAKIRIGLAAPTVLDAADIVGVEGVPVIVSKT